MRASIHKVLAAGLLLAVSVSARAQTDTTGLYGERTDSLEAAVYTAGRSGNYISRTKDLRTEVISSEGLQKMACCNVAESFENSASVTVDYADAVTGARQIRLLGLSGVYTQMLDESRPIMRGLAAPFGLTWLPGQWLESIQIAKGAASVAGGVESVTGQINLEHRKPTDEKPLFISLTGMSDTRLSGDIVSSLRMGEHFSTAILAHADGNFKSFDMNGDGFMDDPHMLQLNLGNRWLYYSPKVQVRFGVQAVRDTRTGGQEGYDAAAYTPGCPLPWGSRIGNTQLGGYLKVGIPLRDDQSESLAAVADFTFQHMDAHFGADAFDARAYSGLLNLLWRNRINERHDFTLGASGVFDRFDESLLRFCPPDETRFRDIADLFTAGVFGEYTYHPTERLSLVGGLRGEWYNAAGWRISPRATLRYTPADFVVLRLNGGRGLRYAMPLTDNIGVFSTGKRWTGDFRFHPMEDAWTYGGNVTFYLPLGADPDNAYISLDFFRTRFTRGLTVDYERTPGCIDFSLEEGLASASNTVQLDFAVTPVERFTINLTARYTDARVHLQDRGLVEKPLTPRFKGVLNLQYKTRLSKWIFDLTAALNGSSRAYAYMELPGNRTPVYPMLFAQITRRFRGIDIYLGGENLTGFRQREVILGTPGSEDFDASAVWGPLMGIRINAGLRFTLWKTY